MLLLLKYFYLVERRNICYGEVGSTENVSQARRGEHGALEGEIVKNFSFISVLLCDDYFPHLPRSTHVGLILRLAREPD